MAFKKPEFKALTALSKNLSKLLEQEYEVARTKLENMKDILEKKGQMEDLRKKYFEKEDK